MHTTHTGNNYIGKRVVGITCPKTDICAAQKPKEAGPPEPSFGLLPTTVGALAHVAVVRRHQVMLRKPGANETRSATATEASPLLWASPRCNRPLRNVCGVSRLCPPRVGLCGHGPSLASLVPPDSRGTGFRFKLWRYHDTGRQSLCTVPTLDFDSSHWRWQGHSRPCTSRSALWCITDTGSQFEGAVPPHVTCHLLSVVDGHPLYKRILPVDDKGRASRHTALACAVHPMPYWRSPGRNRA